MGMSTKSPLGVQVAKAILSGDVSLARALACGVHSWSVTEGRAICGACRVARDRNGWPVRWQDFF